jgi:hypothetical protein
LRESAPEGIRGGNGRLLERGHCRLPQLPEAAWRDAAQRVRRQLDYVDDAQHEKRVGPKGARSLRKSAAEAAIQHGHDVDDQLII